MKNKGFTLIELIAVIIILALIFLVSFPNFMSTARSDKEKEYSEMVESLCLAGKSYIYAHMDEFSDLSISGSEFQLSIEELISYGNVEKDTKNPKTNKLIKDYKLEFSVLDDNSLDCKYIEE